SVPVLSHRPVGDAKCSKKSDRFLVEHEHLRVRRAEGHLAGPGQSFRIGRLAHPGGAGKAVTPFSVDDIDELKPGGPVGRGTGRMREGGSASAASGAGRNRRSAGYQT